MYLFIKHSVFINKQCVMLLSSPLPHFFWFSWRQFCVRYWIYAQTSCSKVISKQSPAACNLVGMQLHSEGFKHLLGISRYLAVILHMHIVSPMSLLLQGLSVEVSGTGAYFQNLLSKRCVQYKKQYKAYFCGITMYNKKKVAVFPKMASKSKCLQTRLC